MNDRDFTYLALFCVALVVIWEFAKAGQTSGITAAQAPSEACGAFPQSWCTPMNDVYCCNPAAYQPPTTADLTINVANQTASELGQAYMPMFGFIGVAQGEMYQ
jgi:hypothetical protein